MRRPPKLRLRTCDVCGEDFRPTGPTQRRHPGDCTRRHNAARLRKARAEGRYAPPPPKGPWTGTRTCRYCRQDFAARSPKAEVCYELACQRAKNADRMRIFQQQYRDQHGVTYAHKHYAEKRASDAAKRRAIVRGAEAELIDRVAIYDRDGWVCQLCNRGIPRVVVWPHPLSASLDHIVPLNREGAHTHDNVQAAHLSCNAAKGDRMEETA